MTTAQFTAWANAETDLDAALGEPDGLDEFCEWMEGQERQQRECLLDDPAFLDFLDAQELLPRAS